MCQLAFGSFLPFLCFSIIRKFEVLWAYKTNFMVKIYDNRWILIEICLNPWLVGDMLTDSSGDFCHPFYSDHPGGSDRKNRWYLIIMYLNPWLVGVLMWLNLYHPFCCDHSTNWSLIGPPQQIHTTASGPVGLVWAVYGWWGGKCHHHHQSSWTSLFFTLSSPRPSLTTSTTWTVTSSLMSFPLFPGF